MIITKAVEDMMNESKTEGAVTVLAGASQDGLLSIKGVTHTVPILTEVHFEGGVKRFDDKTRSK